MSAEKTGIAQGEPASGHAGLISAEPLIISTPTWPGPIGLAPELGAYCRDRAATFLIPLSWHCDDMAARSMAEAMRQHIRRFPRHELIVLANTPAEVEALQAAGAIAFFANHNIFASEEIYFPQTDRPVEFDAVYNARPSPMKRHELAAEISRVIYLGFVTAGQEAVHSRDIVAGLLGRGPGHVLANELLDGFPQWVNRSTVNTTLARASVGLCLSAEEGAMYASIEYLLAGLPVVSTPSRGGRDVFFDPDYCFISAPEPRAVREAVEKLRDRNIPRDYIRTRTLSKLTVERHRFLAFVDGIREKRGASRSYSTGWSYSGAPFHTWRSVTDHARAFVGPVEFRAE